MKRKKYLPLYYKWASKGRIPHFGLCNCFKDCYEFHLLLPEDMNGYWAYDGEPLSADAGINMQRDIDRRIITRDDARHEFTPLRQTIVLFLAAMNNEL